MDTLDFEFRILAVILTVLVSLFFIFRHPAANCLLGFTTFGLGPEKIFETFTFARLVIVIQALTVLFCLFQIIRLGKFVEFFKLIQRGMNIYAMLLLLVWLKVGLDCLTFGVDDYRQAAVKTSIYTVFLPSCIFLFSNVAEAKERANNSFIIGLVVYSLSVFIPLIYPLIAEDRLAAAAYGESRLTLLGLDTINGGRTFFFGSLGFMLAGVTFPMKRAIRTIFFAAALSFFILVLLNGTRQFASAILIAYLIVLILLGRTRRVIVSMLLVGVALTAYSLRGYYSEAQLRERITSENLAFEVSEGRGRIWTEALSEAVRSPFLGVGFRNFGDEYSAILPETGDLVFQRDTAHGFFQDISVEHGLILGPLILVSCLWTIWQAARDQNLRKQPGQLIGGIALLAMSLPEVLSSALFNAFAFHMLAVASITSKTESQRKPTFMTSGE